MNKRDGQLAMEHGPAEAKRLQGTLFPHVSSLCCRWRIQLPNLTTPTVWGDNTFTGFYVKVTDVVELYGHR